ncbi:MAG TPA: oligosaccharide flippase family protein [Edaphobacter sp.]|nr:oligosaccharide flippase family protein [Edaphobacter sp.]
MIHALHAKLKKDDPRFARVLKGGLSGAVGKATAVLVSAVSLPITVRYLGREQYGFWVTISTTIMMLAVLDLGIANTLTNCISRAYAERSEEMAKRYYATAFWTTSVIAILLGLIAVVSRPHIDWGRLFGLSDPTMARQAGRCAAISFGYVLLTLPLGLANKVMSGYQRVPVSNIFSMINSVLGLGAIILVVRMHGSVVDLMAAFCGAMLTGTILLNLWMAFRHEPRIRPTPGRVHLGAAREIMSHGMLFFILQLTGLAVFNTDNLIIAHYLGAEQVTPYAVTLRLVGYASMLQSLLVPSLWPAFSEAYVSHDLAWVRTAYHRVMRATVLTVIPTALFFGFAGRWIIGVWAGKGAVPTSVLLWGMCFWTVLLSITLNQGALLAATQHLQLQAIYSSFAAVLNLILSIILVQHIGANGVLLGTIISYVVFIVFPATWQIRRILQGRYLRANSIHGPRGDPADVIEPMGVSPVLPEEAYLK